MQLLVVGDVVVGVGDGTTVGDRDGFALGDGGKVGNGVGVGVGVLVGNVVGVVGWDAGEWGGNVVGVVVWGAGEWGGNVVGVVVFRAGVMGGVPEQHAPVAHRASRLHQPFVQPPPTSVAFHTQDCGAKSSFSRSLTSITMAAMIKPTTLTPLAPVATCLLVRFIYFGRKKIGTVHAVRKWAQNGPHAAGHACRNFGRTLSGCLGTLGGPRPPAGSLAAPIVGVPSRVGAGEGLLSMDTINFIQQNWRVRFSHLSMPDVPCSASTRANSGETWKARP